MYITDGFLLCFLVGQHHSESCWPHLSPANEPSSCCSPLTYSTTLSTSIASTLSYKHRIWQNMKKIILILIILVLLVRNSFNGVYTVIFEGLYLKYLLQHRSMLLQRGEITLLSVDLPGQHWGCRADGGRVQCWHWCLRSRADRIWWSLWSLGGSCGAAAPSDPSQSAPSRCHSSAGTLTVCTPAQKHVQTVQHLDFNCV